VLENESPTDRLTHSTNESTMIRDDTIVDQQRRREITSRQVSRDDSRVPPSKRQRHSDSHDSPKRRVSREPADDLPSKKIKIGDTVSTSDEETTDRSFNDNQSDSSDNKIASFVSSLSSPQTDDTATDCYHSHKLRRLTRQCTSESLEVHAVDSGTESEAVIDFGKEDIGLEIDSQIASEVLFPSVPVKRTVEAVSPTQTKESASLFNLLLSDFLLLLSLVLATMLIAVSYSISNQYAAKLSFPENDCIYVSGGGFSGFWFSLGRLHTIPEPEKAHYVCFSAGCLGVVATLANQTMQEMYEIASTVQKHWQSGDLHRYHIIDTFVDKLLYSSSSSFDESKLSALHIMTSTTTPSSDDDDDSSSSPFGLLQASMQTPTDMEHLKTLLIQTTWIPLVVGSESTYDGHMDGFFSTWQHPTCNKYVGLTPNVDLYFNTLNLNLGAQSVDKFWNMGLEYGL
jgi:hypothetical protein